MSLFRKQTRWERVMGAVVKATPDSRTVRTVLGAVGDRRVARSALTVVAGVVGVTAASAGVSSLRGRSEQ